MANLRRVARNKALKYGLDPAIFVRQIGAESGFNPTARSPAGALGVAQIMPATARGWGVDPLKPRQALDAAAKNMAAYVKRYGGYENALRAYNAGPGAIEASKGYAETNAYVSKILGGTDPGRLGQPRSPGVSRNSRNSGPRAPGRVELGQQTTFDEAGYEKARNAALVGGLIAKRKGTDSILFRTGVLTTTPPNRSDFQSVQSVRSTVVSPRRDRSDAPRRQRRNSPGVLPRRPASSLLEMFYNGPGGINVKNGKRVGKGFVDGHTEHVHVGAPPRQADALGRLAQQMGLTVLENETFDPVAPVHSPNSLHYSNRAIDVSGGTPAKLAAFSKKVARIYGV